MTLKLASFTHKPVPLTVWVYAAILSLIILWVIFYKLLEIAPPSDAFFEFNSSRLNNIQPEKSIKIVMLGDSRLRYASYSDKEISEKMSNRLGKSVVLTRIVNNWAVFHDFSLLIEPIIKLEPDLIVIQETLLSKDRTELAHKLLSRKYLFWRYLGRGKWNPGNLDQHQLQEESRCEVLDNNESVEERKSRAYKWFTFTTKGESQTTLKQFINSTHEKNIPVIYISLPITSKGQQGLPRPITPENTAVLHYPEQIPDTMFCDLVHMNNEGRTLYSNWLINELSQIITSKTSK